MKKIFALFLSMILFTACTQSPSPSETIAQPDAGVTTAAPETAAPETEAPETEIPETEAPAQTAAAADETIAETVLFERDGVKVTAKSFNRDEWLGPQLSLLVENSTEQNITVSTKYSAVNGCMVNPWFSCDVAAGKKSNDVVSYSEDELALSGITTFADMEFIFNVYETESWNDLFDTELISLKTMAADGFEYKYNEEGTVIFDEGGIKITAMDLVYDDFWGTSLPLHIHNTSDKAVCVSLEDISVNDYMLSVFFGEDVLQGHHCYGEATFYSEDLEANGIDSIEKCEFVIRITESGTYDDIAVSDTITVTFN